MNRERRMETGNCHEVLKGVCRKFIHCTPGHKAGDGPFCLGAAIRQDDTEEVTFHLFSQRMSRFLFNDGVGNTGLRRDKS